jgi:hypothetical protein
MNLKECRALHRELRAAIDSSDKRVADIILQSNVSNDAVFRIFQATKELLSRLLINQEQQLALYFTHRTNTSEHISIFCASLEMNIAITNQMMVNLIKKVRCYVGSSLSSLLIRL